MSEQLTIYDERVVNGDFYRNDIIADDEGRLYVIWEEEVGGFTHIRKYDNEQKLLGKSLAIKFWEQPFYTTNRRWVSEEELKKIKEAKETEQKAADLATPATGDSGWSTAKHGWIAPDGTFYHCTNLDGYWAMCYGLVKSQKLLENPVLTKEYVGNKNEEALLKAGYIQLDSWGGKGESMFRRPSVDKITDGQAIVMDRVLALTNAPTPFWYEPPSLWVKGMAPTPTAGLLPSHH